MKRILTFLFPLIFLAGIAQATLTATTVPVTKTGGSSPVLQNGSITDLGTASGPANVGINSTTPGAQLDVEGTIRATSFIGLGVLPFNNVTGTTQAIAVNTGYIANNSGLVTLTLPSTATVGQMVAVVGSGAGGWIIDQNASQLIQFDGLVSTTGTGGSLASTSQFDAVELICVVTNTTWVVRSYVGTLTAT